MIEVKIKNTMFALISSAARPIMFLIIGIGKHGCSECGRALA